MVVEQRVYELKFDQEIDTVLLVLSENLRVLKPGSHLCDKPYRTSVNQA